MIGKIGPLVEREHPRRLVLLHVAGGAIGGAASGAVLGFLGIVIAHAAGTGFMVHSFAIVVPLVLAYAGIADLPIRLIPRLTFTRQTPGSWTCSLGEPGGIWAWGVDLGTGISTRLPFHSVLAVLVAAVLIGDFLVALIAMTVYGLTRASAVALVVGATTAPQSVCSVLNRNQPSIHAVVGITSLGLAVLLVVAYAEPLLVGR